MFELERCAVVFAVLMSIIGSDALGQQLAASGAEARSAETVVVTGTRASGRTVENSAAPIDVVSAPDLENTGRGNLLDALNDLLPSFNLPALVQPDLGSMVRGAQLRNQDPSFTLVLVNGKRRHTTSLVNPDGFPGSVAVDLSLIPIAAIDHIEVLRDGASAIYGSDAIAGVINIVLKSANHGASLSAQGGVTYKGDGVNEIVRGSVGTPLGEPGFLNLALEVDHQSEAKRNFPLRPGYLSYPAVDSNGQLVPLGPNNSLPAGTTPNPLEASRDPNVWRNVGQPYFQTEALSANSGYALNDAISLYGFATYAHRESWSAENFRLPARIFANVYDGTPAGYAGALGAMSVYPLGFTPYETITEDDESITGGAKGKVSGTDWDLSATYGQDYLKAYTRHSQNWSLPYPGSPTNFYVGSTRYSLLTTNLDLHRAIDNTIFSRPIDAAAGVEYDGERDSVGAGQPASYIGSGSQANSGTFPADANNTSRHRYAGYLGLSAYVVPRWFVDLAGRVEHYSDFGSVNTGRLSSRFEVTDEVALRATVSNGYHAPSLVAESFTQTADQFTSVQLLARPNSPAALALGATPLKPEKARNYTIGIALTPEPDLHVALDLYQIDVDNVLNLSSNVGYDATGSQVVDANGNVLSDAQVGQIDALLATAGLRVPTNGAFFAQYFQNVADTRTRGADLTLDAISRLPDNSGRLRWTLAANYNKTSLRSIAPTPAALQGLPDIVLLDESTKYHLLYRAPTDKEVAGVTYEYGPWSVAARETHYGALKRLGGNGVTYDIDQAFVTDLSASYTFAGGVSLTAGADNLTNTYPSTIPYAAQSSSTRATYTNAYDNSGPLGVLGGFYYVRVAVVF